MKKTFFAALFVILALEFTFSQECLSRDYGNDGTVCVCNANHCDLTPPIQRVEETKYVRITSNKAGLRLQQEVGDFVAVNPDAENVIKIGVKTYQKIIGFGGAFTDSTGFNIKSLSLDIQDKLLRSYFGNDGIEYSIGRVPMGGTDFSLEGYTYCDTENDTPDPELKLFNLTVADYQYKVPYIQKALELKNNIKLFTSAWIAPSWMRTVSGFLAKPAYIKEEYYQSWADYFVKFLREYKKNNISFWGVTTGNEPLTAFTFSQVPAVAWGINDSIKWIKENLGPSIRNSEFSDIKIIMLDDQKILIPAIPLLLFEDESVKNYVDGIGIHWYADPITPPIVLDYTNERYPEKFILSTEACSGYSDNKVLLGSWHRGEEYADNIIMDINHWVTGWTDWNMVLNTQGGPTFIQNFVDSPVIVNATAQEFYKQPMFYVMGHFSKYVPTDSIRLEVTSFSGQVPVSAFKRPDNGTTLVILNKDDNDINVTIRDETKGDIVLKISAKSITSIVYW